MFLIGIDEVGRGPLAGPVTICAVLIKKNYRRHFLKICRDIGVNDSKKLSAKKREKIAKRVRELKEKGLIDFVIASQSAKEIDKKGISRAIALAIARSLKSFSHRHGFDLEKYFVFLDGSLEAPPEFKNQKTIIRGDSKEPLISLASIIAKVYRDKLMVEQAKNYLEYGFEENKGYGTLSHRQAIKKHGISSFHRKTFCTKISSIKS